MNSARRRQIVKEQKREARKEFLTELIGWTTIASLTYFLWEGFFWLLMHPLWTWF